VKSCFSFESDNVDSVGSAHTELQCWQRSGGMNSKFSWSQSEWQKNLCIWPKRDACFLHVCKTDSDQKNQERVSGSISYTAVSVL